MKRCTSPCGTLRDIIDADGPLGTFGQSHQLHVPTGTLTCLEYRLVSVHGELRDMNVHNVPPVTRQRFEELWAAAEDMPAQDPKP